MFFGFVNLTLYVIGWILWRRENAADSGIDEKPSYSALRSKTAILMPIRHENTLQVRARLASTWRSCVAEGLDSDCDIWLLSDSDRTEIAASEDVIVSSLNEEFSLENSENTPKFRLLRRNSREKYKAGNIANFLENYGEFYEYAVVLDADSLMGGQTIRRLIERMEVSPNTALLQTVVLPVRSRTPYAQLLEFSTRRTLPLYARGMYWWCEGEGIYWGHNALFRIKPFMQHCNLPILPGKPPLGGHVLSQDIVEAALLCRGGWKVEWDLREQASFDELPIDFIEYIKRDSRWCQGNFQHSWLILGDRIRMSHRLYFLIGIMSYAFSALILLLIGFGLTLDMWDGVVDLNLKGVVAFIVFLGALICLPRSLGLARTRAIRGRLPRDEIAFMILEAVVSIVTAPLLFYAHTVCILGILRGKAVKWGAPNREDLSGVSWKRATSAYWGASLIGIVVVLATWWRLDTVPLLLWPVVWSFLFSVPIVRLLSSPRIGVYLNRKNTLPHASAPGEKELVPD